MDDAWLTEGSPAAKPTSLPTSPMTSAPLVENARLMNLGEIKTRPSPYGGKRAAKDADAFLAASPRASRLPRPPPASFAADASKIRARAWSPETKDGGGGAKKSAMPAIKIAAPVVAAPRPRVVVQVAEASSAPKKPRDAVDATTTTPREPPSPVFKPPGYVRAAVAAAKTAPEEPVASAAAASLAAAAVIRSPACVGGRGNRRA